MARAAALLVAVVLALASDARAAPPAELTPPSAGQRPAGLVIVLHGGDWLGGNGVGTHVSPASLIAAARAERALLKRTGGRALR